VRFKPLVLALATVGISFSACAGDSAAEGSGKVSVTAKEMKFSPSTVHLAPGTNVFVVRNKGKLRHTFSLNALGREVTIEPGKSKSFSVDLEPGTYRYVCRILDHEGLGMRGTVRVRAS
jgi:plastocyanin